MVISEIIYFWENLMPVCGWIDLTIFAGIALKKDREKYSQNLSFSLNSDFFPQSEHFFPSNLQIIRRFEKKFAYFEKIRILEKITDFENPFLMIFDSVNCQKYTHCHRYSSTKYLLDTIMIQCIYIFINNSEGFYMKMLSLLK